MRKQIRDTKGKFHAKIGTIKDRNGMDLTEAEDIKKRWQEYTRRPIQNNPDNHDGVTTRLEPDILECEVKWALESITMNKASGDDGIPVELFQILKDDAVKVLHSSQQFWKTHSGLRTGKGQFPFQSLRKAMTNCVQRDRVEREVGGGIGMGNTCKPMALSFQCMTKSTTNKKKSKNKQTNYCTIALILQDNKVMLKLLQARLQKYVNCELPDDQPGFRKGKEPEIKLQTSTGSSKMQESCRKITPSPLLIMSKPLTMRITIN